MTTAALPVRGGTFAEILRGKSGEALRKPPRVVTLPLDGWADNHEDKPGAPIPIGLRLIQEEDVNRARDAAEKEVETFSSSGDADDRVRAYNDALIREYLAAATCQAMDVTQPFFEMGALDIRRRLTSSGVTRLWQEHETMREAANVSMPEIEDDGLAHIFAMLDRGVAWRHLPPEEAKKCRRLLEYVRQNLAEGEERAERSGELVLPDQDGDDDALPGPLAAALLALEQRPPQPQQKVT